MVPTASVLAQGQYIVRCHDPSIASRLCDGRRAVRVCADEEGDDRYRLLLGDDVYHALLYDLYFPVETHLVANEETLHKHADVNQMLVVYGMLC